MKDKEKIAQENRKESEMAMEQAKKQRQQDLDNGVKPLINSVADGVMQKLLDKYKKDE